MFDTTSSLKALTEVSVMNSVADAESGSVLAEFQREDWKASGGNR